VCLPTYVLTSGLDDWPTHLIRMEAGRVTYAGKAELAPKVAPAAGASGSLFQTVRAWLDDECVARKSAPMDVCNDSSGASALEPPKPAATGFASKFDRFGGAGRQSMFAR